MSASMYTVLSVMMFLEFAVWGAWSPVLAARLLGPLKMSGKQTGWIYGTFPLAAIVAPLVAGQVADRWLNAEWILLAAHALGAVLLLLAARQQTFGRLFVVMGLYSLCYAATLPLVNSLMFRQLGEAYKDPAMVSLESAKIFIWAPVAWAVVGWLLAGWRRVKGTGDGSDCLLLGAGLSLVMAAACLLLPKTPPQGSGDLQPFIDWLQSISTNVDFLTFLIVSFLVTAQLQFYYLGTARFLEDIGVQSKNVPAVMAIAQVAQALATWYLLGLLLKRGFNPTLVAGIGCWLLMYLAYSATRPRWFVVTSQALHGCAYVFFIIGGQIYVNSVAPLNVQSTAQSLLFAVTMGFGLFVGTQFTGVVMDALRQEGKFRWRQIYLVPCALTLASAVALAALFHP